MASESSTEYKVVADKIVSPDNNINIVVAGNVYVGATQANNRVATMADVNNGGGGGGNADIADFTFEYNEEDEESRLTIHNHDMRIQTTRDANEDADIDINSADDIWITANDDIELTSAAGEVRVYTGGEGGPHWEFRPDGIVGVHNNISGLEAIDGGDIKGRLRFEPNNGRALLQAYSSNNTATFTDAWDTATWTTVNPGLSQLNLTNASTIIGFMNDTGYNVDVLKIAINQSIYGIYDGASTGDGAITFDILGLIPEEEGITVTEIAFQYAFSSRVDIDFDEGDLTIRTEDEMDIVLDAADDVIIRTQSGDVFINPDGGAYLGITATSNAQIATIGDIQSAGTADFVFSTVEEPDYESTMTVTNNDMVIKTVVDTEASGNIRVESAQGVTVDANGDILIESKNGSDVVKARLTLDQSNEQVLIEAIDPNDSFFDDTQWATAVWTGTAITITNTPDIINFFDNAPGNVSDVSVNNGVLVTYQGASYGSGNITIDVGGTPPEGEDPLTVTSIRFYYPIVSKIDINYDSGTFDIDARNMPIEMSSTSHINVSSGDDVTITAGGDDLRLRAWDDITFTAGYTNGDQYEWRMNNNGRFELPASGYIQNPNNASSDGNGLDTLHLVPDFEGIDGGTDQYIIIEPTAPNHVHIRAGGTIDASNAELILGGEVNNVQISDADGDVNINANSAIDITSGGTMSLTANGGDMNLYMDGGLYIGNSASDNQILKRSDISNVSRVVSVPETAGSTGTAGQIAVDSSYLYVCVASNTWKRVALSTW